MVTIAKQRRIIDRSVLNGRLDDMLDRAETGPGGLRREILELLKSRQIRVQQAQPFDEIWIEPLTDVAAGGDAESSVAITTVSSHQEAGEAAGAGDR